MKKLLLYPLLILAALLASCSAIDPIDEKAEYTNCVVYSVDTLTNVGLATDYATIKVLADLSTMLFQVSFSDVKLLTDSAEQDFTVKGLTQYLKDVTASDGTVEYLYTFFTYAGSPYSTGFTPRDFRFGWLSTVYWTTFACGPCRVWSLPKKLQTYANKNTIINAHEDEFYENAIHPRYDLTLDVENQTVSISGRGIVFPTTNQATGNIEIRNQYNLNDLKINYTYKGFTSTAAEIWPVVDGETGKYKITDFYLNFDADYDDEHEMSYTLTDTSTGNSVKITTQLGYNSDRIY